MDKIINKEFDAGTRITTFFVWKFWSKRRRRISSSLTRQLDVDYQL